MIWSGEQFDDRWCSNGHLSLRNSFNQTLLPTAWIWGERHEKGTFWSGLGCGMWIRDWQVNNLWSPGLLCNQNQEGRLKPNSKHYPKSKARPFLWSLNPLKHKLWKSPRLLDITLLQLFIRNNLVCYAAHVTPCPLELGQTEGSRTWAESWVPPLQPGCHTWDVNFAGVIAHTRLCS